MSDNMDLDKLSIAHEVIDLMRDTSDEEISELDLARDVIDEEHSEGSSGYVTTTPPSENTVVGFSESCSENNITCEPILSELEAKLKYFLEPVYSEQMEYEDGMLTNEEFGKKYPEFLAHRGITGHEGQHSRSLLLPNKFVAQLNPPSTVRESTNSEQTSGESGISDTKELKELPKKTKEVIKMSSAAIKKAEEKGVFCCNGLQLNERSSSAFIPDSKHADIKAFMEAANAGDIQYATGKVTPEEMKKITTVIKVNFREDHEDVITVFFAATAEFADDPTKKYTAFATLEKAQAFDLYGERGFFAYYCKVHGKGTGKTVRIGQHVIKWSSKRSWARWENKALDDLMGHPKKVVENFGQPPMDLRGIRRNDDDPRP